MEWVTKSVGNTCSLATGGTPSRAKPEYFEGGGIKWLVSGDIHQKEIFDCNGRITELGLQNSNARYLPKNSVMIALNGQGKTRGTVSILRTEATCNQSLVSICPNNTDELLPEFLYINLHGRYEEIRRMTGDDGNDRRGLNMPLIRSIQIPLPPTPEQQRIVAILDQTFADIEKARANAEKNLKNARELFDSYLNQVFSQRGEGWVEKPLGDVICKTHTKDPRKNPELKFLYVDVSSVSNTTLEITEATELLGKDAPSRARRVISEGNVIFATVRPTLKRIAIVPNRLDGEICSTGYFVFKTSDELNNRYLYYFLQSYCFMGEMEKLQSGASYPAVNDSQVKQTIIKYPSIIEQQSIVASLDKLSMEVQQLEKGYQEKLTSLGELKKSLLQKAFSGELTKTEGHAA